MRDCGVMKKASPQLQFAVSPRCTSFRQYTLIAAAVALWQGITTKEPVRLSTSTFNKVLLERFERSFETHGYRGVAPSLQKPPRSAQATRLCGTMPESKSCQSDRPRA